MERTAGLFDPEHLESGVLQIDYDCDGIGDGDDDDDDGEW